MLLKADSVKTYTLRSVDIHILELKFKFQGNKGFIYPVLLKNQKEFLLVDCGYPGFMPLIEDAAKLLHLSLRDLTGIIITHDDIDHLGGLFEIKSKYPNLKVYSSKIEEPFISGKEKSPRLKQAEDLFDSLPEEYKPEALRFQLMLRNIQPVTVDYTFSEDGKFPYWQDLYIIDTPGHTAGHISIYLKSTKTLIAADALVLENGEFEIANPQFTLDLRQAVESINKLNQLEIETLICYHGGIVKDDISSKLKKLIKKYQPNLI